MREIKASTKVTGKRWLASVAAARAKVKDGEWYLIRRHGAFFRPNAHGYTTELGGAGIYAGTTAKGYLDVEGLSVIPLRSVLHWLQPELEMHQSAVVTLSNMLTAAKEGVPTPCVT